MGSGVGVPPKSCRALEAPEDPPKRKLLKLRHLFLGSSDNMDHRILGSIFE